MSDVAVRVEGLGKRYKLGGSGRPPYKSLRESLMNAATAPFRGGRNGQDKGEGERELWALKDVTFEVKHGEVLGIIGRNGAGKSTLLKILSRITEPTAGYADVYGRVGALLEVGTGFHPELTGAENIYLSGAILGMSREDIKRRFDEIVAFAELERFLETPVKRYSSGMYMRLAFSVAAHLEPEVLVVDEVLAVGDAEFQKKCLGKMGEVAGEGRTVLFISHNMAAIERLCSVAIWLDRGIVKNVGVPRLLIVEYSRSGYASEGDLTPIRERTGTGAFRFMNYSLRNSGGDRLVAVSTGCPVDICLQYEIKQEALPARTLHIALGLHDSGAGPLFHLATDTTQALDLLNPPRRGVITCRLPELPLMPGQYSLNLFAKLDGDIADWLQGAASIEVSQGDFFGTGRLPPSGQGPFVVRHSWEIEEHHA